MAVLVEYECPCCGGKVEFDSGSQALKCPYCETVFDAQALEEYRQILEAQQAEDPDHADWQKEKQRWLDQEKQGLKVYSCRSCGGEIITDDTTAAGHCPYCGNPIIMVGNLSDGLRPDGVLPFALDRQGAVAALENHMKGKKLMVKAFAGENRLKEVEGLYVPFWLFDGECQGSVQASATRVRTWRTSTHIHTETKHYSVSRAGSVAFRQIPVDGAQKIPNDLMETVEPFDFDKNEPFDSKYLAGFSAERYDVDADACQARAAQRAKETLADRLMDTIQGYSTVNRQRSEGHLRKVSAQYVLCPVWLLRAVYEGQTYLFAVNGQTGRVAGNMPLDKKKALGYRIGYTLGIWAVLGVLASLLMELDWMLLLGALGIAFLIANALVGGMEQEVQNVAPRTGAGEYVLGDGVRLSARQDRFLYANVTRTPIPKDPPKKK